MSDPEHRKLRILRGCFYKIRNPWPVFKEPVFKHIVI